MDIFIGGSSEQNDILLEIANIIEKYNHNPINWDKPGLFRPGIHTLNRIIEIAHEVDAAILIFSEDDKVWYRNDITSQPRDNVIFEHGVFTGILGAENTVILKVGNAKIASDLRGITYIDFSDGKKQRGNLELKEWLKNLKSKKGIKVSATETKTDNKVSDFFYTLDDKDKTDASFPSLIQDAKKVYVLARTSVNLLSIYERNIIELVKMECDVRFLFVGPDSDAVKYIYGTDPDIYFSNAERMKHHLERISKNTGKGIKVKTIKHAPTVSIIYIEKNNGESFVVVQFYFLHSRIGRDRPMFKLNEEDNWFNAFKDEFDKLWEDSDEWEYSEKVK